MLGGGEDLVSEEGGGPGQPQETQTGMCDHLDYHDGDDGDCDDDARSMMQASGDADW